MVLTNLKSVFQIGSGLYFLQQETFHTRKHYPVMLIQFITNPELIVFCTRFSYLLENVFVASDFTAKNERESRYALVLFHR